MTRAASAQSPSYPTVRSRWPRWLAHARRSGQLIRATELLTLLAIVGIFAASYFIVTRAGSPGRLLSPPAVAAMLVANLVPIMAGFVLIARRFALRRAASGTIGGRGRMHVRLVALFSVIAAVPTLFVVIFASLLFQYGVEFWLSDRVAAVLTNASDLARESYEQSLTRWSNEAVATSGDIASNFGPALAKTTDPATLLKARETQYGLTLPDYLLQQLYNRNLSEGALFTVNGSDVQFIARVDPYGDAAQQIDPVGVSSVLHDGKPVITVKGNRIRMLSLVPGSRQVLLYAGKVSDGSISDRQTKRFTDVVTDFKALQARARALQLQFNAALLVVALLIVVIAVWIALVVADRLVRPVGQMVDAARRVAGGDLSVRVLETGEKDEIGTLANAFNTMTVRLEQQTGALESRRALIEAVMSGVSAGVVSVGGDGAIRLINASAAELLRLDAAQAVGAQLFAVSPELADTMAAGVRDSIVQLSAGGEARTLAVRITGDEDGQVLTFDDITQQLLDQRRAAWSDVARRIAHEIKNPLTPIQLAAERLQRRYGKTIEPEDTIFSQLTDTIVRQVGDLRRMVDEFSSFARMPKPVFHEESLIDLARQSIFLHEVAHPAIRFTLDSPDAAPLVCDRRQIGQALTNIVKNAVEAIEAREGGEAGAITVKLRTDGPDDHHLTVEVADNGIGLPVERDRIVEPYMTTRARGTGLGLAIVKKIIEEHCGTIAFADRPGGGTIVTIVFDSGALQALVSDPPGLSTDRGDAALAKLTRTKA